MSAPGTANYWPTEQQALILRAALSPPEPAMIAWLSLRERLDLDSIDPASRRLLPLLERSLRRLGVGDPVLARCKGIHQHAWGLEALREVPRNALARAVRRLGGRRLRQPGAEAR